MEPLWKPIRKQVLPQDRHILEQRLVFNNLARERFLCWVAVVVMGGTALVAALLGHGLYPGYPEGLYTANLIVRLVWVSGSLAFLLFSGKPASPREVTRRHLLFHRGLLIFAMILGAAHSLILQPVFHNVTIYALACFSFAALIRLTGPEILGSFGITWLAVFLLLPLFQSESGFLISNLLTGTVLTFLAMFTARALYANEVREFLDQRMIQRQKAELERMSYVDSLTGLPNRRHLDQALGQEWRRAARGGQHLATLMADIDHFKAYNDTFGHQAGDECLRAVASALQNTLQREGDLVARYGGEEFAVLLPGVDLEGARRVAENLRVAVSGLNINNPGSPLGRLTISLGLASRPVSAKNNPKNLMARADRALYQAKQKGRNCTAGWTESGLPGFRREQPAG